MIQTRTATYRDWSEIVRYLELTDDERSEAEAYIDPLAAWPLSVPREARYMLIPPDVATAALIHAFRACSPEGPDTEDLVSNVPDAVRGCYVNMAG